MVIEWLKLKEIKTNPYTYYGDIKYSIYYPANSQLILLWNILPFRNDNLANVYQWPLVILAAISCYGISNILGVSSKHALLSTVFFLISPIVLFQSISTYHDTMYTSFFLMGIYFLLSYKISHKSSFLILSFISIGIMLGTKYVSLLYLPIYFLIFLSIIKKKFIKNKLFSILLISIIVFFGGIWYIRNYLTKGSLFFPIFEGINIMNFRVSYYTGSSRIIDRILYPFVDSYAKNKGIYTLETGYGPHFAIIGILSIVISLIISVNLRKNRTFFISGFLILLSYFLLPFFDPRYFLPLLAFSSISFSYIINYSEKAIQHIFIGILILSFLFIIFKIAPFLYSPSITQVFKRDVSRYEFYTLSWGDHGQLFKFFNDNVKNSNVVVLHPSVYPFYGEEYTNNIIYLEDYNITAENLKKKNIDYLVIANEFLNRNSKLRNFLETSNMIQKMAETGDKGPLGFSIYKVIRTI
jgi:4-amino-4-deoxy-L-arabinose transferase-like glycosyltransferase